MFANESILVHLGSGVADATALHFYPVITHKKNVLKLLVLHIMGSRRIISVMLKQPGVIMKGLAAEWSGVRASRNKLFYDRRQPSISSAFEISPASFTSSV